MEICEIRIPTYKRPEWLKRAIESALSQDYPYLRIIVLDDSPTCEGRDVVEKLSDDRIVYRPNGRNLGGAANTDQAFTNGPLAGGSYACVLDDDNWLLGSFVSRNIALLKTTGAAVALRNQTVWEQSHDGVRPLEMTTRGDYFEPCDSVLSPIELYAHLLFHEGISHGGMFWSTSLKSNLVVGPTVKDAGLAEHCRTLQIIEPLAFGAEPLAAFTLMPRDMLARTRVRNRQFGRARQSIARFLLARYDGALVEHARRIAARARKESHLYEALADALYFDSRATRPAALRRLPKALARLLLVENPLAIYLADFKVKPLLESSAV